MRKTRRIGQAGEDKIAEILSTIPASRLMRNQYIPYGHGHQDRWQLPPQRMDRPFERQARQKACPL